MGCRVNEEELKTEGSPAVDFFGGRGEFKGAAEGPGATDQAPSEITKIDEK